MRNKFPKALISMLLILSLITGTLAADTSAMEDISGHWAEDSILYCLEQGLYTGVSETVFSPDTSMTRGMFVTVLGRFAEVDTDEYEDWYLENLYDDVDASMYYAPYINWATRYGIVNGTGDGAFSPEEPITREQMATIIVRFASIYNYSIGTVSGTIADCFLDADTISEYAQDTVETLRMTGILNGYSVEGGYEFQPQGTATRAECAALFCRLSQALHPYTGRTLVDPTELTVSIEATELNVGDQTRLSAVVLPEDASNKTITWVSSDPTIAMVGTDGVVTAVSAGTADLYGYTWNGLEQSVTVTVTQSADLAYAGESYEDKCIRVFGEVVSEPRTYYSAQGIDPSEYLVTIAVKVWDFTDSTYTTKTTKTLYLQVHKNLAATVEAIFDEIYNGDEQFPIYSVGGYYNGNMSEHTSGLAIDINPDYNYYCNPSGEAITGSCWDPENNPYSIPLEGDVVEAFEKYGFTRGIYWNSGYKDYMHFSFFAT